MGGERSEARRGHEPGGEAERDRRPHRRRHERHPLRDERAAPAAGSAGARDRRRAEALLEGLVAHHLAHHHVEDPRQPHPARVGADDLDPVGDPVLAREGLDDGHEHRLALDRDHAAGPEERGHDGPDAGAGAEVEHGLARAHARDERAVEGAVPPRVGEERLLVGEAAQQACERWTLRAAHAAYRPPGEARAMASSSSRVSRSSRLSASARSRGTSNRSTTASTTAAPVLDPSSCSQTKAATRFRLRIESRSAPRPARGTSTYSSPIRRPTMRSERAQASSSRGTGQGTASTRARLPARSRAANPPASETRARTGAPRPCPRAALDRRDRGEHVPGRERRVEQEAAVGLRPPG